MPRLRAFQGINMVQIRIQGAELQTKQARHGQTALELQATGAGREEDAAAERGEAPRSGKARSGAESREADPV